MGFLANLVVSPPTIAGGVEAGDPRGLTPACFANSALMRANAIWLAFAELAAARLA